MTVVTSQWRHTYASVGIAAHYFADSIKLPVSTFHTCSLTFCGAVKSHYSCRALISAKWFSGKLYVESGSWDAADQCVDIAFKAS